MRPSRAVALLVAVAAALAAPAAAAAGRSLLAPTTCKKSSSPTIERRYHNAYPVNNYAKNCVAPVNAPCRASDGCSLFDRMQKACQDPRQASRCVGGGQGFVYTGRLGCSRNPITGQSDQGHVISIAVAPVRGMEDVHDNKAAASSTAGIFKTMWEESLADRTGSDLLEGFTADRGGLVVNPPNHREFHQLHIHAGAWRTEAFDACLANMKASSTGWQLATCPGLSEGNEIKNCANPPPGKSCQSATFAYKAVTDLSTIWADYKDGLQQLVAAKAVAGAKPSEYKYFAGVLVTRGAAVSHQSQKLVAVYVPSDADPANGLGRGHFLYKGAIGSNQHPSC